MPKKQYPPLADAQRELAGANLGLVYFAMAKLRVRRVCRDECYEAGTDALLRAARGFDAALGNRFSSYAMIGITREIADARRKVWRRLRIDQRLEGSLDDVEQRPPTRGADPDWLIRRLLAGVDDRTRELVRKRFWLDQPLRDIAVLHEISGERVRQILEVAFAQMRCASSVYA